LSGDLQIEVMAHVWDLGEATVDDVRARQRRSTRSAYTTIQTVINRLVDRGLLTRERRGRAFVYKPRYREPEYNNYVYESEITKGLNVFRFSDLRTSGAIRLQHLNPQTQEFSLP